MTCDKIGVLLSKYVDNELTDSERSSVEEHIRICPLCGQTLSIFLRNDRILESSLTTDMFGESVVSAVMQKVNEKETKPITRVISKEAIPLNIRSILTVTSIAATVLITITTLILTYNSKVATLTDEIGRQKELNRWISNMAKNMPNPNSNTMLANIDSNAVEIRGTFINNKEKVLYYSVYRKNIKEGADYELLYRSLKKPEYTDSTAIDGESYEYKFTALTESGRKIESLPIYIALKPTIWPSTQDYTEIKYMQTDEASSSVLLSVVKTFSGKQKEELFVVKIGEEIGKKVQGADFRTGLKILKIDDEDDDITITSAKTKMDETGMPILNPRTGKPETEYEPLSFTRINKKITLQNDSGAKVGLFQGRSLKIAAK